MASASSENWNCTVDDKFDRMEVPEINEALLMDLLEESHEEEEAGAKDEKLGRVIQSLEAEIDPHMNCSIFEPEFNVNHNGSPSHIHNWSNWFDMEVASASPNDDTGIYYVDSFTNEIVRITEFEELRDYSQMYYGGPLDEQAYSSLWQETYDSVIYG